MEYEHVDYNNYQQLQENRRARDSGGRKTNSYERGRGLNKPTGMRNPEISVHIIQPQEFKDLVQRLTGAPQYRQELSPRTTTSMESPDRIMPDSPPAYNQYAAAAEDTYYTGEHYHRQQQHHHHHWQSTSMGTYNHPSSPVSNYQQNHCNSYSTSTAYEPCSYSPAYAMQSPSPHSPQSFDMDLPPLSPSDNIWAEGWRS